MTSRARSRGCLSNVKRAHFTVDEPALIVRTAGGVVIEFAQLSTDHPLGGASGSGEQESSTTLDLLTDRNGVLKRGPTTITREPTATTHPAEPTGSQTALTVGACAR